MATIWFQIRAEWRSRWRAVVAIALVAGIAGAATLAAFAGAHRTRTAFDRLRVATRAFDVMVNPDWGSGSGLRARDIARIPGVLDVGRANGVPLADLDERSVDAVFGTIPLASDGRVFYTQSRPKLLDGRLPRPERADEIWVDRTFVRRKHLGVGDVWHPSIPTAAVPSDFAPNPQVIDELLAGRHRGWFRRLSLRIVGVGVDQTNLVVDQGYDFPGIGLTPAFARVHRFFTPYWGAVVRLRPGASLTRFERAVERLVPEEPIAFQTAVGLRAKADRAIRPQAAALTIFAVVLAVTGALVVGQSLARQSALDSRDHETLRSLGVTRAQLFGLGMARTVPVALAAAAFAVLAAWLLSPLTPIGVARVAEPDAGLAFDARILGLGALAIVGSVLALATFPAWRATRSLAGTPAPRSSRVARLLAAGRVPPTAAAGIRQALEAGRGATAVPVRTTLSSAAIAVAAVTAAAVVAASLSHLVETPRLFGWNWDAIVGIDSESAASMPREVQRTERALDREPVVASWTHFAISTARIGGQPLTTLGVTPSGGGPRFVTPTGRLPRRRGEVALGSHTMRSLDARVGGHVIAAGKSGRPTRLTVVGRVVLPGFGTYPGSDKTSPAEGAVVTAGQLAAIAPVFGADHELIAFRPDAPPSARAAMIARFSQTTGQDPNSVASIQQPSDVVAYRGIRSTPLVLSGLLALLAILTLAHGLVSSIRRRRRDLALLKTLGFTRSQVRRSVAWNATTVTLIATVVGVPVGLVAGRSAWRVLVEDLGVVDVTTVPWVALAVGAVALLVIANVVALFPGRIAADLRPAAVLRSE